MLKKTVRDGDQKKTDQQEHARSDRLKEDKFKPAPTATIRRRFLPQIEALFVQVLVLAREMKCLKLGNIALDRATQDRGQRQQAQSPVVEARQQDRGATARRSAAAAQADRRQRQPPRQ